MKLSSITRSSMAAILTAIATFSTAAAGDLTNHAIRGPEAEGGTIKDSTGKKHQFNIKPVTYRVLGGTTWVFGQLSHHMRAQPDDQLWYGIVKRRDGAPEIKIIKLEKNYLSKWLDCISKVEDYEEFAKHPVVKAGIMAVKNGRKIANRGKGWEGAATRFIQDVAERVDQLRPVQRHAGVTLYQNSMMQGSRKAFGRTSVPSLTPHEMNDRVSSLTAFVPNGMVLELFEHSNFRGKKMVLRPGSHVIQSLNIHGRNDSFSSFRFGRGR